MTLPHVRPIQLRLSGYGIHQRALSVLMICLLVASASLPATRADAQGRNVSFVRDTEIENTIRYYLQPIYEVAGVDASSVQIHLISDERLNAFVANGQRIFIHTGLLMRADDPGQVIGVLAHELGHITGGHLSQFRDNLENSQTMAIAGLLLGLGGALATGDGQVAAAGASLGQQIGERSFLQYTRANEQAADQAAATYLEEAGISPRGLRDFLLVLQEQNRLYSAGANPYTQTHPLTEDRITFMENQVRVSSAADSELPDVFALIHARMRAKLSGYIQPERTLQQFPVSDESAPARYARSMAYMQLGRSEEALAEINLLLEESPEDPFYWEVKGDILRNARRLPDAAEAYRKAVSILPWAALIRANLANVLLEQNDPLLVQEALDHANVAVAYEPDFTQGWHLKGQAHERRGETGMVLLTQAEVAIRRGDMERARNTARRAMEILPEGSASWIQAQDISYRADG